MADKKSAVDHRGRSPRRAAHFNRHRWSRCYRRAGSTATGRFTFDPGFMSTASCESKITYIDGDNAYFAAPGYPIEQSGIENRDHRKLATCC